MRKYLLLTMALLLTQTAVLWAADTVTAQAVRAAAPPQLDGELDDPCWQELPQYNNFTVLGSGEEAAVQTYFRVAYDTEALYVAIVCPEPAMDQLQAALTSHDDTIWTDDCVELLIDPSNQRQSYVHLIVNANGAIYDSWVTNAGISSDMDFESGAEAATSKKEDAWQVEMRLPYAGLHLDRDVRQTWALNVCRERKTDQPQLSCWAPTLSEGFNHPESFGELTDLRVNFRGHLITVDTPTFKDPYFENDQVTGTLLIPYVNWTGQAIPVRVKAVFTDLDGNTSETEAYSALQRGRGRMPLAVSVKQPGFADLELTISRRNSGKLLTRSRHPMTLDYQPIQIDFLQPAYRDTIYASLPDPEIVCALKVNVPRKQLVGAELRVSLNSGTTELAVRREKRLLPRGEAEVAFSAEAMPAGTYTIKAQAIKDDQIIAESEKTVRKLKPQPHEVIIDNEGRLRANGRLFFPSGFMGAGPDERIAKAGFNTIHTYTAWYTHRDQDLNEWLDKAQELGLKVIMYPYPGESGFHGFRGHPNLTDQDFEDIRQFVETYKSHPALLAWYMCDEPRGAVWRASLKRVYELLAETDPYHPCVALDNSASTLLKLQHAGDILWLDPYPGFAKDGGPRAPLTIVSQAIDDVLAGADASKPLWVAPQAFSYGEWSEERKATERAPNLTEVRCMHYLSLLSGAQGIVPFAWAYVQRHPSTLNAYLESIGPEMAILTPVILEGEQIRTARVATRDPKSDVRVKAWEQGGDMYIVVVNAGPEEQSVRIVVPGLGAQWLKVLSENRRTQAFANAIEETLPGYGVRVFTTRKRLPSLLTLDQIERRISNDEAAAGTTW